MIKKAYVFPGQAAQFVGMGKDLYEKSTLAQELFEQANSILGYRISDIMFHGTDADLKQTKVTQPSVFLHSVIKARMAGDDFKPAAVAGHSLGEFSALTAAGSLSFEAGLRLVQQRALAMQAACEAVESTMAAVLGLSEEAIEKICLEIRHETGGIVVAANYNCPGQLVISGDVPTIQKAIERLKTAGAKRAIVLQVGGAFHSPCMEPAEDALRDSIQHTSFKKPICPIYQNVDAKPHTEPKIIRENLIRQLTAPVRWTQIMRNMLKDDINHITECGGSGTILRGFFRQIDKQLANDCL